MNTYTIQINEQQRAIIVAALEKFTTIRGFDGFADPGDEQQEAANLIHMMQINCVEGLRTHCVNGLCL